MEYLHKRWYYFFFFILRKVITFDINHRASIIFLQLNGIHIAVSASITFRINKNTFGHTTEHNFATHGNHISNFSRDRETQRKTTTKRNFFFFLQISRAYIRFKKFASKSYNKSWKRNNSHRVFRLILYLLWFDQHSTLIKIRKCTSRTKIYFVKQNFLARKMLNEKRRNEETKINTLIPIKIMFQVFRSLKYKHQPEQ